MIGIFSAVKAIANPFLKLTQNAGKRLDGRSSVITQEVSGNALQRNWRPLFMYLFWVIVANNYLVAPYVRWMGGDLPLLEIPPEMWTLITVGMGGYIGGRTIEKAMASLVKGKRGKRRRKGGDNKGDGKPNDGR